MDWEHWAVLGAEVCKRNVRWTWTVRVWLTRRDWREGVWQLRRLYNNRVMWVCREAQGAAGGEGGAAHGLEGDHVEAVRVRLEVDQV